MTTKSATQGNKSQTNIDQRDEEEISNSTFDSTEYLKKQAWDYFQLHSGQRLTTFNFYIVISSVLTTAMVATFQKDYKMPIGGVLLGIVLFIFSIVFYKLDRRNKHLIQNAENAIAVFENRVEKNTSEAIPNPTKIFSLDAFETVKRKSHNTLNPFKRNFSYSDVFLIIFSLFGLTGILGALASIWLSNKAQ